MGKGISRPEIGEAAPRFRLRATGHTAGRGQARAEIALEDFIGKKNVVLAFVPAAFTPV